MNAVLSAIERRIFRSRGTLYEAEIFSILSHCLCVLRAFEFALADGAINCTYDFLPKSSWAERFWHCNSLAQTLSESSELMPFEVKSSVGGEAGQQKYITSKAQQRRVAFYIGKCAADPGWVDVIPNFAQEEAALDDQSTVEQDERVEVAVNTTKLSRLPPSAYGYLDQSSAPYRMPIRLLPVAIERIRRIVTHKEVYVNPWTDQAFPEWHPKTTRSTRWFEPEEGHSQHAAYLAVREIVRVIQQAPQSGIAPDFVLLQPRIADFKLRLLDSNREVFVQHKLDEEPRKMGKPLKRVTVARGDGDERGWYFSAFERFDYIWYQFLFAQYPRPQTVALFLPEHIIPDHFYRSTEKNQDFSIFPEKYRVVLDEDGDWVGKIEAIIRDNPTPRRQVERPVRAEELLSRNTSEDETLLDEVPIAQKSGKGQREYKQVMDRFHCRFFYNTMLECARRRFGSLVVFARNHPSMDVGFCHYGWSDDEVQQFFDHQIPPVVAHELPVDVELVPICLYTQYAETSFQGPNVRAQQLRRLDSCGEHKLVVWDLGGHDDPDLMPVVIPSTDISPTSEQRAIFKANLEQDKNKGGWETSNPGLSSLLSTGLWASDYAVRPRGPFASQHEGWSDIYDMLLKFAGHESFEHPQGIQRKPSDFRHTLRRAHEVLLNEHKNGMGPDDLFE